MRAIRPFLKAYLPAIAWYGIIFILSSIPGDSFPESIAVIPDLIPHFALFAVQGLLLARCFPSPLSQKKAGLALAICAVLGLLDEIHQIFVRNRQFSLPDLIWDLIGSAASILIFRHLRSRAAGRKASAADL